MDSIRGIRMTRGEADLDVIAVDVGRELDRGVLAEGEGRDAERDNTSGRCVRVARIGLTLPGIVGGPETEGMGAGVVGREGGGVGAGVIVNEGGGGMDVGETFADVGGGTTADTDGEVGSGSLFP